MNYDLKLNIRRRCTAPSAPRRRPASTARSWRHRIKKELSIYICVYIYREREGAELEALYESNTNRSNNDNNNDNNDNNDKNNDDNSKTDNSNTNDIMNSHNTNDNSKTNNSNTNDSNMIMNDNNNDNNTFQVSAWRPGRQGRPGARARAGRGEGAAGGGR